MGEIKSVKVDNWGVFFLQKLQNFFNKTDYCDLTLQFNDNSQLKVHKLVLSACTDYFNVLEQTCEMIDDILIMPNELQADLVVPIVNFMYTGTLEFELKMYGKLLKTARDMNMTVLLKLLEAHRRTMEGGTKQVVRNTKTSPRQTYLNAGIKPTASIPTIIETSSGNTGQAKRRILSTKIEPYRKLQIKPISSTTYTDSNTILTRYPNTKITPIKGPSRFEYEGENILQDTFESSFDTISYESKPLKEEILDDDDDNQQKQPIKQESTTSLQFEQLRHTGYNNNKRPAQSILQSPPTKKPNIQDVKEYAEQQRMRKQIAEEYGEEFEDTLDDEFHNADDDEEYNISAPIKHQVTNKKLPTTSNLRQKSQHNQINKKTIALTTKQEEKPRIVVKDSTSSNVDHAKIISEVLRKYPHLIKNNKNIKLKIMPNASGNGGPQRVVIKKESDTNMSPVPSTSKIAMTTGIQEAKVLKFSPQQKVTTTTIAAQVQPSTVAASTTTAVAQSSSQPRRIDSKTMKALISLGAENTTGPWLCLRCGVNGRPISIPSYRGFRRHLTNTHKEKIDARLCEHCGWRSTTQKELLFHMQMEHQIKCNINFPKCEHCNLVVLDLAALDDHIDEYHLENKEENQQCIYCNKTFSTEILLYNHMKAQHKERARDDGVIDFSDDEHTGEFVDDNEVVDDSNNYEQESTNQKLSPPKIQILSDINLSKCISLTKSTDLPANTLQQEHTITTSDATILGNIDYITTSTAEDTGPKFVNAEGNVMELTQAQRDEIISQLEQSGDGVVMVLNDESFVNDEKITNIVDSSTGKIQSIASQQFGDNMLIVYDQQQTITTSKTNEKIIKENKEEKKLSKEDEGDDDEEMECKNDVSQDEIEKETTEELENEENINQAINDKKEFEDISKTKKEDKDSSDLDMKLKLLTGDWTEDEDEDEECHHISDDKENKKNKASGDDKILDILEKNNDSSDITSENIKTELKDDNVKPEIQEQHENDENQNISAKTEDIEEIETKKDHKIADDSKNNDDEENFETYTDHSEKDEEILFSTEIGSTFEEKTVEQKPNIDENDDNKSVVTPIIETDTKETTDNSAENMDNKEEKEENSEELRKIKESDKTTLHEEFSVGEERNDDVSKKDDELKTVSISHDIIEELEKIEDENLSKSDENDQVIAHVTTTESKDEIDELSQTKTKDEIKNLISEWGEDDDDL